MTEEPKTETPETQESPSTEAKPELSPEELKTELSRARRDAKRYRESRNQLEEALRLATEEKDRHASELGKYQVELRTIKHKTAFTEVAKSLKVREDALDDLWQLSNYAPDNDEVDENQLQALLKGVVERRPYLLAEKKPLEKGEGADRGGNFQGEGFYVSKAETMNPIWMQANFAKLAEAQKNGTLRWKS